MLKMPEADDGLVVVVWVKYDKASLDVPLDLDRSASHFLLEVRGPLKTSCDRPRVAHLTRAGVGHLLKTRARPRSTFHDAASTFFFFVITLKPRVRRYSHVLNS